VQTIFKDRERTKKITWKFSIFKIHNNNEEK
jgi:hypothetical protein